MKILQIDTWFGASLKYADKLDMEPIIEQRGFVTEQGVYEAINKLMKYQKLSDELYPSTTTCYTLLSVCDIDTRLTDDQIDFMRLVNVDDLPTTIEEMKEY